MVPESILFLEKVIFVVVTVAIGVYCIIRLSKLGGLSRRLLLAGFFYSVHELSFFLGDQVIFEMTKVLFFLVFFYTLVGVIVLDEETRKRLEETAQVNVHMMKRLDTLKKSRKRRTRRKPEESPPGQLP